MKQKTKFKQTEIGKIPEDWEVTKIGNFVDIKHGFAFKGEFFSEIPNNNILLTPGNFKIGGGFKSDKFRYTNEKSPKAYILKEGDIIVTMTDLSKMGDTLGYSAKIPKMGDLKFLHNQRVGLLMFKNDKIEKEFILWVLRDRKYNHFIVGSSTGSTVKHTSPDRIKEYAFAFPPLPEQRLIASVLSSLDDKIELNNKMNKTLEAIGQAIFKKWFIDEKKEGWEIKALSEIANYLNGLALQKYPPKGENDLPVIKIRELKNGITENTDKANSNLPQDYIIKDGDILFSWSGSLEVVIWGNGRGALNQHLFKVSSEKYPKWFYYYWTLNHLQEFKMIAEGKATTMGHIKRHHLDDAKCLVPDEKTLEKMSKTMMPLIDMQIKNMIETRTLSKIRDALLPKLMNGEVRVK